MPDPLPPSPDHILASGDPGDDTARRYRYQWTYAAISCCLMLDGTEDTVEVFCEHHEDVLLKHADNTFSGLQIKTRSSDQEVWKTGDEAFTKSCARFAKLEVDFPGQFRRFRFLTNHPLHAAKNNQDICHVLAIIKAAASAASLPSGVTSFLSKIAKEAGCSDEVAFVAMQKTEANGDLPKIPDVMTRLAQTLTDVWNRAEECPFSSVKRAARALVNECQEASSLAHENVLPAYLSVTADPVSTELAARLAGKRINRERMLRVLDQGLNELATLETESDLLIDPGRGTSDLLRKKLDAGGFSAVSRNSAEDLRDKADYLGLVWTKKHGRTTGLQRYTHVRSLVLSDAARAFEQATRDDAKFGIDMLSQLRVRFRERRREGDQLYDSTDEHLEGFAYALTSECKVVWSNDRPWEVE
jgi:Cap4-like dsDNA endonuclease family protein